MLAIYRPVLLSFSQWVFISIIKILSVVSETKMHCTIMSLNVYHSRSASLGAVFSLGLEENLRIIDKIETLRKMLQFPRNQSFSVMFGMVFITSRVAFFSVWRRGRFFREFDRRGVLRKCSTSENITFDGILYSKKV